MDANAAHRLPPLTLALGLTIILLCEVFLFIDVQQRGGLIVPIPPDAELHMEPTLVGRIARTVGWNMTPFCWIGYLLTFDGLLALLARRRGDRGIASIRARPNRFIVAWLTSIPVWCVFDYINFRYLDAWRYHGMPPSTVGRTIGYFLAFAAISPGMFLAAQFFQQAGMHRLRIDSERINRVLPAAVLVGVNVILAAATLLILHFAETRAAETIGLAGTAVMLLTPGLLLLAVTRRLEWGSIGFGAGFSAWAVLALDPVGNMALWVGLIFLLDPIAGWLGGERGVSILRDWRAGRWGRMLALFAGGALCGLLWEFWNYWALSKWTYHLPFLGPLEHVRYFEMPLLGFLGFLPFALECWVMLNVIIAVMEKVGLRVAERLPDEGHVF